VFAAIRFTHIFSWTTAELHLPFVGLFGTCFEIDIRHSRERGNDGFSGDRAISIEKKQLRKRSGHQIAVLAGRRDGCKFDF
jgi:hypothetical protein